MSQTQRLYWSDSLQINEILVQEKNMLPDIPGHVIKSLAYARTFFS